MSFIYEERSSESPYVETVMRGRTVRNGSSIRPAESHWHMVFAKHEGSLYPFVVGPWTISGVVAFEEGAEILWIKFKLGTFMPHLPPKYCLNVETLLPGAASQSFWLKSAVWQFPNYENADAFIQRLVREDVLVFDPVISEVLQGHAQQMPIRTIRHHFLRATGVSLSHIRQAERAQQAAALLEQGVPIQDTVYQVGYFDQPHLTRSFKRFVGQTPKQWIQKLPAKTIRLNVSE